MRGEIHVKPLGQLGQQGLRQLVRRQGAKRRVVVRAFDQLLRWDAPEHAIAGEQQDAAILGGHFHPTIDEMVLAIPPDRDVIHGRRRADHDQAKKGE